MLHLSLMRDFDTLVTNVHRSNELLVWQEELGQLDGTDAPRKMDSFQYEALSDHFQPKPTVELMPLPPTQQPLMTSPHSFRAKFSSWNDVNAAKCPPYPLQRASDSFQDLGFLI